MPAFVAPIAYCVLGLAVIGALLYFTRKLWKAGATEQRAVQQEKTIETVQKAKEVGERIDAGTDPAFNKRVHDKYHRP